MGPLLERLRLRSSNISHIWLLRVFEGSHIDSALLALRLESLFPYGGIAVTQSDSMIRIADSRGLLTRQVLSALNVEASGVTLGAAAQIEGPVVLGGVGSSFQATADAIAANLEAILNVESLEASQVLEGFPEVRNSVVNFGIHLGFGRSTSSVSDHELVSALRSAIACFEPRLDAASLGVSVDRIDSDGDGSVLRLLVEGTLKGVHAGERVRMLTQFDRALGHVNTRAH